MEGLKAIHGLNILHGDATPSNLIVPHSESNPNGAVWIDFLTRSRLVQDMMEVRGDPDMPPYAIPYDWETATQSDVVRLWNAVYEYFSDCECEEIASKKFADVPQYPAERPAPSVEIMEPRPSKSLWEAEAEWKTLGKLPEYIAEIRDASSD